MLHKHKIVSFNILFISCTFTTPSHCFFLPSWLFPVLPFNSIWPERIYLEAGPVTEL